MGWGEGIEEDFNGNGSTHTHGGRWRTEAARGRAVIRVTARTRSCQEPPFLCNAKREWDEDGGRGPEESGIVVPYGKW